MADIFVISDFCWSRPAAEVEITRAWQLAGIPPSEYRKAVYLFCPAAPETAAARAASGVWHLSGYPRLFREFALLPPGPEACREFAGRYGLLHLPGSHPWTLECQRADGTAAGVAESVREWVMPMLRLRALVELWDLCRSDDDGAIADRVVWAGPGDGQQGVCLKQDPLEVESLGCDIGGFEFQREVEPHEARWRLRTHLSREELVAAGVRPGDSRKAAYALLLAQTEQLMRDVGPYLPSFGLDRRDGCRVSFRPVNLIGAIVLQFALAVVGNKDYRQCRLERCGRWFEVVATPGSERVYCSDSCRTREYHERRKQAREMHAQGVPLERIAEQLETEMDKVKFWVAATRQRRTRRQVEEAENR